jgi:hypothetical protein
MDQYLLLLHENPADYDDISPFEMQAIIDRYRQWSQRMAAEGRIAGGHKLTDEGGKRIRAGRSGGAPVVTDGPYAEAKDVVGGLFIINASSYEDAVRIASTCPHVRGDNVVEVRKIEVT